MNNNQRLSEIITTKLKEKKLIKENSDIESKLANGTLKESDWKFYLEDVLIKAELDNPQIKGNETE